MNETFQSVNTSECANLGFATEAAKLRCTLPGRRLEQLVCENPVEKKRIKFILEIRGVDKEVITVQTFWVEQDNVSGIGATCRVFGTIHEAVEYYTKI